MILTRLQHPHATTARHRSQSRDMSKRDKHWRTWCAEVGASQPSARAPLRQFPALQEQLGRLRALNSASVRSAIAALRCMPPGVRQTAVSSCQMTGTPSLVTCALIAINQTVHAALHSVLQAEARMVASAA